MKIWVLLVAKVQPAVMIPAYEWLILTKAESIKRSWINISANLNGYEILSVEFGEIDDFCGYFGHGSVF